jgi:outer membrane protein OmpA-like peptidoglycan-associated protein
MSIRWIARLGCALAVAAVAAGAGVAEAAGVRLYGAGETPSPGELAEILRAPRQSVPVKTRSIRMVDEAPTMAEPGAPGRRVAEPVGDSTAQSPLESVAEVAAPAPSLAVAVPAPSVAPAVPAPSVAPAVPAPSVGAAVPAPTAAPVGAGPATDAAAGSSRDRVPSSFALPVQFAFDSSRLLPEAYRQLDAVAAGIRLAGPGVRVVIEGHTDSVGSAEYNLRLSSLRAESVRTYLIVRHGIDPSQLRVVGMGEFKPLPWSAPSASENRRVEFRAEG